MKKAVRKIAILLLVCMLVGMIPLQAAAANGMKDTSKIFKDISPKAWYKEPVDYVYTLGLFNGTSDTTFEPEATVDRAMFVTVLARMDGAKVNNKATTKFTDVPKGQWYTGSVKWAADNGIVNGATATTFEPFTAISREQMCAMLVRYADYKDITLKKNIAKAAFADDADISPYAKSAVYACQRAGIVNGVTATKFDPAATATRGQAAKILMIFHQDYIVTKTKPVPPADDPTDKPIVPPVDDPADEPVTPPPAEENETLKELLENKTKLRFNEDGDFKVMVLADLHAKATGLSKEQQDYVKTMVDREQPDLVILTGDNVRSLAAAPIVDAAHMRRVLDTAVGYLEEKGIYWMHVYGNHDDEDNPLDKEAQQAVYEGYEYCLSKDVQELSGVGNYVVPLYGSDESEDEIKFAFWGLDSGTYMTEEDKKALFPDGQSVYGDSKSINYDYIHYDQIKWYEKTSEQLEAYAGGKVPGLMAFHIPIQEYYTAWLNREGTEWDGAKNEVVAASAYNSGLFEVIRNRGDVKAIVCGHDHMNTFMVNYAGIKLCYSPTISTNSYYDEKEMGCRVFTLSEEDPASVDTYMSYLNERPDYNKAEPIADGYTYDFEGAAPTFAKGGNNGWQSADVNTIAVSVKEGVGKDGSKGLATMRTGWSDQGAGYRSIQLIWDMPFGKVGDNKYLAVWVDFAKNNVKLRLGCFGVIVDGNYSTHYETDANNTITDFFIKGESDTKWTTLQTNSDGCMVGLEGFKGWIAVPLDGMRQVGTGASLTPESVVTGLLVFNAPASEEMVNKEYYYDNFTFVKDYKSVSPETEQPETAEGVVVTDFEGTALTVDDITKSGNAGSTAAHLDTIGLEIKEGVGRNGSKGLAVKRTAWDSTAGKVGYNSIQLIWDIEPMKKGDNEYLAVWVDFAKNDAELRIGCFGVIVDGNYTNHYETDAYDKVCEFYTKAEGATQWTTQQTNSDGCMMSLKGFKGWIAVPLNTMEQYKNQEKFLTADSNITGILLFNAPNYEAQVGKEFYYDDFTFVKDYRDID